MTDAGRQPPAQSLLEAVADVDAAVDPQEALRYLRGMHAVPAVQRVKERSFELMGAGPGDRVVDVGCGDGRDVGRLSRRVAPGGEAIGVDPSEVLLAEARRSQPGTFLRGRAEALPLGDATVAACRAERLAYHLSAPTTAVREMARVVRPGGRVVLCEISFRLRGAEDPQPEVTAALLARLTGPETGRSWIGHYIPPLLRRAGLEDVAGEAVVEESREPEDADRCFDAAGAERLPAQHKRVQAWRARLREDMAAGRRRLEVEGHFFHARRPQAHSSTSRV